MEVMALAPQQDYHYPDSPDATKPAVDILPLLLPSMRPLLPPHDPLLRLLLELNPSVHPESDLEHPPHCHCRSRAWQRDRITGPVSRACVPATEPERLL